MLKTCFKCKIEQPIENFYKHKAMSDGHLNKCKNCTRNDVIEHRRNNDSVREYDRWRYQNNPDKKFKTDQNAKNWINKNPEARKAHKIVYNAIKSRRLIRQPCSVCGTTERIHAHHKDYSKPLEVEWFCAKHHQRHHYG